MTQEEFDDQIAALVKYNSDLSAIKSKVLDVAMLKNLKIENEADTIDTVLDKIADKLNKTEGEIIIKSNKQIVDVANFNTAKVEILGPDEYYEHHVSMSLRVVAKTKVLSIESTILDTMVQKDILFYSRRNTPYESLDDLYSDIGSNAEIVLSLDPITTTYNNVVWNISLDKLVNYELIGSVSNANGASGYFDPIINEETSVSDSGTLSPKLIYYSGAIPPNLFNFVEAKVVAIFTSTSNEQFSFTDNLTIVNQEGVFTVTDDYSGINGNVLKVDAAAGKITYEIEKTYSGQTAMVTCVLDFANLTTEASATVIGLSTTWKGTLVISSKI